MQGGDVQKDLWGKGDVRLEKRSMFLYSVQITAAKTEAAQEVEESDCKVGLGQRRS